MLILQNEINNHKIINAYEKASYSFYDSNGINC